MDARRRSCGRFAVAALAMALASGCAPKPSTPATDPTRSPEPSSATSPARTPSSPAPLPATHPTRPPSPPKNVTYSKDRHYYWSPWYDGAWQEMVPFGCTDAPYYPRDRTCPSAKPGRHHGVDMFMPCGTRLRSAVAGFVVRSPGLVGPAYGKYGLIVRSATFDYVIGHAQRLYVRPGQHVRPGQLIARSGKLAAPDGCHLHFEKRPAGHPYTDAINPLKSLRRSVVRFANS